MKVYSICVLLSFLLLIIDSQAQTFLVQGTVKNKLTDAPLMYSNIRVAGTSTGTAANRDGHFELRLPMGEHKLIASYLGYISDTVWINLDSDIGPLDIKLNESIVNLSEVLVFPGINPALAIIRKAVERKHEREKEFNSYVLNAFTKGIIKTTQEITARGSSASISIGSDSSELKITGILENQSIGYFKKPNKYKEQIIARKQSSNFPASINTLTGGRIIQNFYTDDVQFFGRKLTSPLSDEALSFYFFYIADTVSINNQLVYKIRMTPDKEINAGFVGDVFISGNTFDLLKVDLQLNRAANTGGIFDTIIITQQFYPFENNVYMPVDYRLYLTANVLGLFKFGFELNTVMYDYNINEQISDDFFDKAVLTVLTDADQKDSTYWYSLQKIPNTKDELTAYKRIDSLEAVPISFWDKFSWLSTRINLDKNFSVYAPLAMYHYNRVEGHAIDFGLTATDLFNNRFGSTINISNGLADKKLKWDLQGSYLFGEYRTYKISVKAFDRKNILYGNSTDYNELSTTLLALLVKNDFNEYFYSKGGSISLSDFIA